MSKGRFGLAAAAFAAAMVMSGCAWFGKEKPANPLVGTWTTPLRNTWTLKADGTFEVDVDGDHARDTWGKYGIKNDLVTFIGVGGLRPKGCESRGVYRFVREGDTLHLRLVSDPCRLRRKNLQLPWRLKQ